MNGLGQKIQWVKIWYCWANSQIIGTNIVLDKRGAIGEGVYV